MPTAYSSIVVFLSKGVKVVLEKSIGQVPAGVSNRHLHVSRDDLNTLFGDNYELTPLKDLSQTGQFAAEETVTLVTRKGCLQNARILGPVRPATQVEISRTDAFGLGIKPPVRDSGVIDQSAGVTIVGPAGAVTLKFGVILAQRHIHMSDDDAAQFGVKDKDVVKVRADGERAVVFENVLVRVRQDFVLELHLDTDEANAAGIANGQMLDIYR